MCFISFFGRVGGGGSARPYPNKRTLCTRIFFCTPLEEGMERGGGRKGNASHSWGDTWRLVMCCLSAVCLYFIYCILLSVKKNKTKKQNLHLNSREAEKATWTMLSIANQVTYAQFLRITH